MIYKERVTTNVGRGVSIYEGNQGQVLMKKGEQIKEQAQRGLEQAKEIEEKGYKLGLSQGINQLSSDEQLMNNPQALGDELDKLAQNVTSNITDQEMKINVLTDFELSKGSYINKAMANMKKIQAENARSTAYDSVYSGIDSLSTSFGNAINGNYDENDIVNYQYSLDRIKANINARNLDGTYMFSDSERRSMMKDADNALIDGFVESYSLLPEQKQREITEAINSDSYDIISMENGGINIKDVVGERSYADVKRKINQYNKKMMAEKAAIKKYERELAFEDYMNNPTEEGNEYLKSTYSMSDKKKQELDDILYNSPNYDAVTTFKDFESLELAAQDFADMEFDNSEQAMDKAIGLIHKAMRSQEKGGYSADDFNTFKNKIIGTLRDENVKRGFQELSNYKKSFWDKVIDYGTITDSRQSIKTKRAQKMIEKKSQEAIKQFDSLVMSGNIEEAKKVLNSARKQIIIYAHPELDGKEIGDRVTINGIVYELTGEDSLRRAK